MKRLLPGAIFALSLHAQATVAPFGGWTVCAYVTPIPVWAVDICNNMPANTPEPWMLSAIAKSSRTVAFRYQIAFVDSQGTAGNISGVFQRQDQGTSAETILWPVPGLNGKMETITVSYQELIVTEGKYGATQRE